MTGCVRDGGGTFVETQTFGGDVTFFDSIRDSWGNSWTSNRRVIFGGGPFELGNSIGLELRVVDATGTAYVAALDMSIQRFEFNDSFNFCFDDFFSGYRRCTEATSRAVHWVGGAVKVPST